MKFYSLAVIFSLLLFPQTVFSEEIPPYYKEARQLTRRFIEIMKDIGLQDYMNEEMLSLHLRKTASEVAIIRGSKGTSAKLKAFFRIKLIQDQREQAIFLAAYKKAKRASGKYTVIDGLGSPVNV